MNQLRYTIFLGCGLCLFSAGALAQSRSYEPERGTYEYCQDRAREISRYYGAIPAEYESDGGAIRGALKGASDAAGLAWITGGSKEDRKKAAKRGAAIGALIGAIKKGEQDKKRRENSEKRRRYEIELDACMRDGRRR